MQKKRHLHPGDILQDPRLERVLGAILSVGPNFAAADVYEDLAKLRVLQVRSKGTSKRMEHVKNNGEHLDEPACVCSSSVSPHPCYICNTHGHLAPLWHCSPSTSFCAYPARHILSGCMASGCRLL